MTRRATLSTIALGIACSPILCCWITFASCCCPRRLRSHGGSEDKRRFEKRQAMAPRPLPVRPPERAVTIRNRSENDASELESKELRGMVLDQSASKLMQLPLELRQLIYRAAIGDSVMHMVLKKHKLGYIRCKDPTATDCSLEYSRCFSRNTWSAFAEIPDEPPPTDGDVLPLLLTCRQIYSEAVDFVYSTNTFAFADLDCLRYFSSTILPHRWSLVQKLDIEWCVSWPIYDSLAQTVLISRPALYPPHDEATWEGTWRIISEMKNLRSLRVTLMYFDVFRDSSCEERLLAPLRQVTLPNKFDVHLRWPGKEITDGPFRAFRPATREADNSSEEWV
ncbi:hypothetical protein BU23DRAFT_148190 [Bimuria novae-zelandiae CBS 107.79]|uniref:DUF7730 domain-containing protein n=1 Tax=Bimuria novae-zelandiae CBS 107.79 TaxID=1447943 RepID=A0A6A5VRA9_9PLEO|nr:hypothetical protein BU23DRAFT_148190 [Bimuria novae-zelandiae CBS 107.79]